MQDRSLPGMDTQREQRRRLQDRALEQRQWLDANCDRGSERHRLLEHRPQREQDLLVSCSRPQHAGKLGLLEYGFGKDAALNTAANRRPP